jgi:hypothetical protein
MGLIRILLRAIFRRNVFFFGGGPFYSLLQLNKSTRVVVKFDKACFNSKTAHR